jgi:hypothetical protein
MAVDGKSPHERACDFLRPIEPAWLMLAPRAAGAKPPRLLWAKAEILGGLSAAVAGLKVLTLPSLAAWGGGALMVLGLYLALAGHRSHLYQALNHQTAYLLQMLERASRRPLY